MALQRIKKTFINRDTRTPYVGFPVTVHAGLSIGSPLRLYSDEGGLTLLSSSGTILTDASGTVDVWVQDYPYYNLILRTVDRRTIIDRIQTNGYGVVDTESIDGLSSEEVSALRDFLVGSSGGTSPVLSVAGRTGIIVLSPSDVSLGNVDNTSDLSKPISTATQAALTAKLDSGAVSPYMLTVLDDASGPDARATLGLGTAATQDASNFAPAVHTHPIDSITLLQPTLDGKQTGIQFQDEGLNLGTSATVAVLNITGSGAQATRVGNVLTINVPGGGSGGVTDHSQLTGLDGDHHLQYLTAGRGDVRYSLLGHTHPNATSITSGYMSNGDKAKLDGIAAGATVNSSDASLRDRSTHTGTQPSSTISDLGEAIDDRVSALLVGGTNVSVVYDDALGTLTINSAGGGGGGGGNTNLAAIAAPSVITITSDTGTDALIGAADSTNAGLFLPAEKIKLAGIAAGATVNQSDAALLSRNNHTGTQAASTISDFAEAVDDRVAALLVAGTNVSFNYNDASNTLTINATGGGGSTNLAVVAAPTTITVTSDTGTDAVIPAADGTNSGLFLPAEKTKLANVADGATANASDAALRDRATHTGTQPASTISDLAEAVDDRVAALLVAGTNVSLDYNDTANTITIDFAGSGGGGGNTNLGTTASPTQVVVTSDTGTDATISAADGTNAGLLLPAEKTKLAGVADGATANSADAFLLNRTNHTGTQAASTISDFAEAVDDRVSSLLTAGPNVDIAYNDISNTLTVSASFAPIVITGDLGVGNTLTATLSGGFATGFQWYRGSTPISGANDIDSTGTVSTYLQDNADVGFVLSVRAVGYVPMSLAGLVPGVGVDTRPRFGLGNANAWTVDPAALLAGMTPISGSLNDGRDGTFNLTTTTGNYGWVAVVASATVSGLRFFDGLGYGGWSGAGLPGNNNGESPDPSISSVTYDDGTTVWRLFRQDYINANPTPASYTIS